MTSRRAASGSSAVVLLAASRSSSSSRCSRCSTSAPATRASDGRTWDAWKTWSQDEDLREAIITSLLLALLTVVLMVVLLVPTMIWVRLRVPGMSRVVEFLCLLPLTIPALVIVVGIANVYAWVTYLFGDSAAHADLRRTSSWCCPTPTASIDSALAAIDVTTLAEAARRSARAGSP